MLLLRLSSHDLPSLRADNISPPLASCLGDLITLTLLSLLATLLTLPQLSAFRLPLIFTFLFAGILAWTTYTSLRNPISRPILKDGLGWVPLLCAMAISSGTGLVLDEFVTRWKDFGSLAVVIAGRHPSLYEKLDMFASPYVIRTPCIFGRCLHLEAIHRASCGSRRWRKIW